MASGQYDALLVVSFGGPEGNDDVMPFLQNVVRGRNVPPDRLQSVAEHYYLFGGVSPINAQNRALIAALQTELDQHGPKMPIYFGNRNWHPLLPDTLREMASAGVRRALAFCTSAFSSYSSCRQYLENIATAQQEVDGAPEIDKLRAFYNHPGFIEPWVELVRAALEPLPADRRDRVEVVFTAHSIPQVMSDVCPYAIQLMESSALIAASAGLPSWQLAYQSRSGPPQQPWLEPDVNDVLRAIHAAGKTRDVLVIPVGFLSDHLEVVYDLDTESRHLCESLGLNLIRCPTIGVHPRFVSMIRELIVERTMDSTPRLAVGQFGPRPDVCPADCCVFGRGK